MLPVLALGLADGWEWRDGGLWRRDFEHLPKRERVKNMPPPTLPALTPGQREEALTGLSLRKVAAQFPGVSYGAIWRLVQAGRREGDGPGCEGDEGG